MTEIANHAGKEPWPSLEVASAWFDRASMVLALSLLLGFASTVVIVWLGIVKEHHWDLLRDSSNEKVAALDLKAAEANEGAARANARVAELSATAEQLRKDAAVANASLATAQADIATANAEAARAHERAAGLEKEAASLALKAEQLRKRVAPRNLSDEVRNALIEALKPLGPIKYDLAQPEMLEFGSWLTHDLVKIFTSLGWEFQSYDGPLPKQPLPFLLETEIFKMGTRVSPFPQHFIGVESGLIGVRITFDSRFDAGWKASHALMHNLIDIGIPPAFPSNGRASDTFRFENGQWVQTPISEVLHIEIGNK